MPGISISMGIPFRKGGGSWASYWASLFDFLWFERSDNITTTELVDRSGNGNNVTITGKDFATSYIPATSAAIFDCPNNATFIADDTDFLWINRNEESRGVEVSELIGYDFARTIVWYDDDAPHHIRAIGILKSTVSLTEAQINKLHTDFRLPLFWSGVENVNGFIKANRGLAQNVWTAVSVAALDYSDIYVTAVVADGGTIIKRKVVESEYQRLINTGDITKCWFSYHFEAGVKRSNVDYSAYGQGVRNVVNKLYNLSPVAGRFAESVAPYWIVPVGDARPEYTSAGIVFRNPNLDGGDRCGLEYGTTILPNNNNRVRMRGIVISNGFSSWPCGGKGYSNALGFLAILPHADGKLYINFYADAGNKSLSSNVFFTAGVETEFSVTFDVTAELITILKNGVAFQVIDLSTYVTIVYPASAQPDTVGHGRNLGRNTFIGIVKQMELFNL